MPRPRPKSDEIRGWGNPLRPEPKSPTNPEPLGPVPGSNKTQLTPADFAAKARELQRRQRERRLHREKRQQRREAKRQRKQKRRA